MQNNNAEHVKFAIQRVLDTIIEDAAVAEVRGEALRVLERLHAAVGGGPIEMHDGRIYEL